MARRKQFPRFFEDVLGPIASVHVPFGMSPAETDGVSLLPLDAPNAGAGFPTWALMPDYEATGLVTDINVPASEDVGRGAGGAEGPPHSGMFSEDGSEGADAIAHYKPWHLWGEDWGIYFFAEPFRDFVASTAKLAGCGYGEVEPFVMRQILEHELAHFEVEVIATKLEVVFDAPLYVSYLTDRFYEPMRWTSPPWARGSHPGPVEEAFATWREVRYSRRRKPRPPRGYQTAARKLADASPGGYNAWRCADAGNPHISGLVNASIAGLVAGKPQVAPPVAELTVDDLDDVPVYWRGEPAHIPTSAAAKATTRPTPRRLEQWLRTNKAEIRRDRGKGSHVRFWWQGRTGGFSTSRDPVPSRPCKEIAAIFGLRSANDLYSAIMSDRIVSPGPASRT